MCIIIIIVCPCVSLMVLIFAHLFVCVAIIRIYHLYPFSSLNNQNYQSVDVIFKIYSKAFKIFLQSKLGIFKNHLLLGPTIMN